MARFHDPMGSEGCRIVVTGYVSTGEVVATPGSAHVTSEGHIVIDAQGGIGDKGHHGSVVFTGPRNVTVQIGGHDLGA